MRGTTEIAPGESHIDMRDVECRIDTLERYVEDTSLIDRYAAGEAFDSLPWQEADCLDEDEIDELLKLRTLRDEVGQLDAQLISDDAFEDYARDFADDLYGSDNPLFGYVDWERYANDVQMDYTVVEWDGTTYYYLCTRKDLTS